MVSKYEDKIIKRVIEQYAELGESAKERLIDEIMYNGALAAAEEVKKTGVKYFGDLYAEAEENSHKFSKFEGLSSGYKYFDDALMGVRPSETIVIAGPSNLGKTMVALNLVSSIAIINDLKCLIISMEMPADQITNRLYHIAPKESHDKLMGNIMIQTEMDVNTRHVESMIEQYQPNIILIDHIQFLAQQESGLGEYERITNAVKKLHRIALKKGVTMFIISHVAKTRSGKNGRATAADLKGSSSIEQDTDIVFLLNRDEHMRQTGQLEVELVKQRKKSSPVYFQPRILQFNNVRLKEGGEWWNTSAR